MYSKEIHLKLSGELLKEINEAAKANYASRSDYIREAVVRRLKAEQSLAAPAPSAPEIDEDEALLRQYGII